MLSLLDSRGRKPWVAADESSSMRLLRVTTQCAYQVTAAAFVERSSRYTFAQNCVRAQVVLASPASSAASSPFEPRKNGPAARDEDARVGRGWETPIVIGADRLALSTQGLDGSRCPSSLHQSLPCGQRPWFSTYGRWVCSVRTKSIGFIPMPGGRPRGSAPDAPSRSRTSWHCGAAVPFRLIGVTVAPIPRRGSPIRRTAGHPVLHCIGQAPHRRTTGSAP
jgi:hypothetical protein